MKTFQIIYNSRNYLQLLNLFIPIMIHFKSTTVEIIYSYSTMLGLKKESNLQQQKLSIVTQLLLMVVALMDLQQQKLSIVTQHRRNGQMCIYLQQQKLSIVTQPFNTTHNICIYNSRNYLQLLNCMPYRASFYIYNSRNYLQLLN